MLAGIRDRHLLGQEGARPVWPGSHPPV